MVNGFPSNFAQVDKSGRTALHWAAIGGCTEAAKVLVEAGADPMARTASNMTALHASAEGGKVAFIEYIHDFSLQINLFILK